ncbi:hypothetical protein D3C81_1830170 [compost metagenome]
MRRRIAVIGGLQVSHQHITDMAQLAGEITRDLYRFPIQIGGIVAAFKHRLRIVFITLAGYKEQTAPHLFGQVIQCDIELVPDKVINAFIRQHRLAVMGRE